jgi:hypothetical protein
MPGPTFIDGDRIDFCPPEEDIPFLLPKTGEFADEPVGSVILFAVQDADGYTNFGLWFHPNAWRTATRWRPAPTSWITGAGSSDSTESLRP